MNDLLLTGFSVRALVESAVKSGFEDFYAVDFFGDWDLLKLSHNIKVVKSRKEFAKVLREYNGKKIVYSSILENEPELLLSVDEKILGNGYSVIKQVRPGKTWWKLAKKLRIRIPENSLTIPESGIWVRKPFKSGGGRGISIFISRKDEVEPSEDHYFQRFIEGDSFSFLFVANGKDAKLLGTTIQLIGIPELGGNGFKWCGNIYPSELDSHVVDEVMEWIQKIVENVPMKGVAGADIVVRDGVPYLIEINPRFTASIELIEMSIGVSIWDIHINACNGKLPTVIPVPNEYVGKGILYAKDDLKGFNSIDMWRKGFRDIPAEEERIHKGMPVCSVYGRGSSVDEVMKTLKRNRDWVYERGVKKWVDIH